MSVIALLTRDTTVLAVLREAALEGDHTILAVETPEALSEQVRRFTIELIILDLASFASDSELLCRRVRTLPRASQSALLCLVSGSAYAIAQALDAGADDCLRRATLNARELAARLRALLRRSQRVAAAAPLIIYSNERAIKLNGRSVELTPTEFDLLEVLSQQPGEYLTATQLLERVWNYPPGSGDPALVRNHVRNLRRKLEHDPDRPRVVTSAHGRGYTLSVDAQRR
ncbi:MAG: DNA-binding response regulator [Chloroflexi bacterium CFX4]|nr:DNA-binding response regulator [Chloroflexi bacterium CFX4]MDL1921419.1 response regulator transcription factor [Chloroflexi bacterium CFX3]